MNLKYEPASAPLSNPLDGQAQNQAQKERDAAATKATAAAAVHPQPCTLTLLSRFSLRLKCRETFLSTPGMYWIRKAALASLGLV